jgi:hypothetical protein
MVVVSELARAIQLDVAHTAARFGSMGVVRIMARVDALGAVFTFGSR